MACISLNLFQKSKEDINVHDEKFCVFWFLYCLPFWHLDWDLVSIENYGIPKVLVGSGKSRKFPIFQATLIDCCHVFYLLEKDKHSQASCSLSSCGTSDDNVIKRTMILKGITSKIQFPKTTSKKEIKKNADIEQYLSL